MAALDRLVDYSDDEGKDDPGGEEPKSSPKFGDLNSEATASEVGTPEHVVHPSVANLLSGGAMPMAPKKDAEGAGFSPLPEAQVASQPASQPASQDTDYGAVFSPLLVSVDTDALHVELAAAQRLNEKLRTELKNANFTIAELKRRLDAGCEKRSAMSKEIGDLRVRLQAKQVEHAKNAARSGAVLHAVDIVSKHDVALAAQVEHLRRAHSDLLRMRKHSSEFLQQHKQHLSGAGTSEEKPKK